ncbi:hypothetical protein A9G28_00160 [Gilliamella sp. Fer1-1]|jgi:hypothetical protein|uniref:hypothetical protein n=1 Tax=Gilliamella sp. Fer1-1 TaxID=3120240 RepID=UPI00080ED0F0|nr:hypothetical protein [Gilliamella apicola]OCG44399.1 hypothetical protein A9G28_00160 [Gilliamella apicola]
MKKITIVLSVLILTACGDSSQVKQVKDYVYDNIDSTLTVGNALDNRNICNKTKWDSYKDERDRNIVEYTCEFKKDHPNQFLKLTFSGMAGNLKTMLVDKNINITLDDYLKFKEEERRYKNVKYPHYTVYKNYIDAKAKSYIEAKAKLFIYDKLKKALLEIEKSNAFARYQENRKYFLSNKAIIIKEIEEMEESYLVSYLVDDIYGHDDDPTTGILSCNPFFVFSYFHGSTIHIHAKNGSLSNKDLAKRIKQIEEDVTSIQKILFKYDDFSFYMQPSYKSVNLYNDDSRLAFEYLLQGNSTKNITLNTKDGKKTLSVKNYQEILAYIEGIENGIIKNVIERVIDPYNQNITNTINQFEKRTKDIKTESYQQKIKWVLIGERNPSLMSCELEFKADGYPPVKSDSSMSSSCFRNAYKSNYVDQIYNQPIMSFINKVAN